MDEDEPIELIQGSGNVHADFGTPDAGLRQARAIVTGRILKRLDELGWSTRETERATGIAASEVSRIRRVRLERFTLDRLISILGKLDADVDVVIDFKPRDARTEATAA
jgi:predicted XRE-type DNA-binding protein